MEGDAKMNITINSLDPSQKQVLDSLLSNNNKSDISVVYGPPGTGKSHLIVSLLFELATRKNKVLFVSQNTEALEVINRMVKKLERNMKLSSDHLSFLDFCLMLNRTEQRRLKYMKSQRDRIFTRELRLATYIKHTVDMDNIPYNLSFTYLDKVQNENLPEELPLGLDELLANYMHNVENTNMLGPTVKSLSNIDIRKVFSLLRDFKDEYNRFSENNHPTNSLKFISKSNLKVTMPEAHSSVDILSEAVSKISKDVLTRIKSKTDTDIMNVLQLISKMGELQEQLNLSNIQYDALDMETFSKEMRNAISEFDSLEDTDELEIPDKYNDELFVYSIDIKDLNDPSTIENISNNASTATKRLNQVSKKGVSDDQCFDTLLSHCLAEPKFTVTNILAKFPGIKDFDDKKLANLLDELKKWDAQNSFQKHLKRPAAIIDSIKEDTRFKDIEEIIQQEDKLSTILNAIEDSGLTIETFANMVSNAKKSRSAVDPLKNVKESDKIELLNDLLVIKNNIGFFSGQMDKMAVNEINSNCKNILDDISHYDGIISNNTKKASQKTTSEIIEQINCNIRNRNRRLVFEPIISQYAKYLKADPKNTENIVETAKQALSNLGDGFLLKRALDLIALPKEEITINPKDVDSLLAKLTESLDLGIFSDEFYEIKADDTIQMWHDRIKTIRNFANIDEFDSFVEQNQFIAKLKELMGQDNAEDIDEYLKNDPLTYHDFAEKITTDLVKAKYQSLSPAMRARIPSKEYFITYQKELAEERKNYFLKGLAELKLMSEDPAKQLKYDSNWKMASSVMEKIRANSEMIVDAFPIIIATPKEVSKYLKAKKAMFDYVIFDEASQLLPGQALPSIYRADKAIIVGDPHQMPPTLSTTFSFDSFNSDYDEDDADDGNDVSILDIAIPLADYECQHHLKVHYRSESNKLFEPSRKAIYATDGIQSIFEAKSDKMPIDIKDDLGPIDADNFSEISRRITNKIEEDPNATFCLLFTRRDKSGELGFKNYISQNQSANKTIYDLIESGRLLVSTVTNCQGIEGDHSIIYFNHYEYPGSMWFFNEKAGAYKRLNVAITRQRKSLDILMADPRGKWLNVCQNYTQPGTSPNRLKSAELMLSLLTNAGQEVDENYLEDLLGPNATNIDSPLTQELYDKLIEHYDKRLGSDIKIWCEVGWNMLIPDAEARDKNRKNVGYRLDIGIYSPKKKRFVLGIEMDGATYHSGFAKEFADQQRQETLEMKGWHIYRIWSTNWLNDSDAEFNDLVAEIDKLLESDDSEVAETDIDIDHETQLLDTDEQVQAVRSEDGKLDKEALLKYLKRNELNGTPISIKYLKPDSSEDQAVFRKMYIESLSDDYMFASFDEYNSKSYKYSIGRIIDYR